MRATSKTTALRSSGPYSDPLPGVDYTALVRRSLPTFVEADDVTIYEDQHADQGVFFSSNQNKVVDGLLPVRMLVSELPRLLENWAM